MNFLQRYQNLLNAHRVHKPHLTPPPQYLKTDHHDLPGCYLMCSKSCMRDDPKIGLVNTCETGILSGKRVLKINLNDWFVNFDQNIEHIINHINDCFGCEKKMKRRRSDEEEEDGGGGSSSSENKDDMIKRSCYYAITDFRMKDELLHFIENATFKNNGESGWSDNQIETFLIKQSQTLIKYLEETRDGGVDGKEFIRKISHESYSDSEVFGIVNLANV